MLYCVLYDLPHSYSCCVLMASLVARMVGVLAACLLLPSYAFGFSAAPLGLSTSSCNLRNTPTSSAVAAAERILPSSTSSKRQTPGRSGTPIQHPSRRRGGFLLQVPHILLASWRGGWWAPRSVFVLSHVWSSCWCSCLIAEQTVKTFKNYTFVLILAL